MKEILENNNICKLCNRKFNYSYHLFGRSCLENEYKLLGISKPKKVKNRELYLCNHIAKQMHLTGLNNDEKYVLAEKYLTIQYLNKIEYGDLDKQINKLLENIKKSITNTASSIISLSKAYRLYKTTIKFSERLKELEKEFNNQKENKKKEQKLLESMKFIFDIKKITNPIEYQVYYYMQYTFWEMVVVGGYFKKYKLSAVLLQNSLSLFGQIPKNVIIADDETKTKIKGNETFKQKIRNLIDKYGKGKKSFIVNTENNEDDKDINLEFNDDYDLFLSIHGATLNVNATKGEDKIWDIDIKINDTYDFTDWKDKEKTYEKLNPSTSNDEKMKALGNILNNFAVVSMKYGVLKEFQVSTEIKINSKEL